MQYILPDFVLPVLSRFPSYAEGLFQFCANCGGLAAIRSGRGSMKTESVANLHLNVHLWEKRGDT